MEVQWKILMNQDLLIYGLTQRELPQVTLQKLIWYQKEIQILLDGAIGSGSAGAQTLDVSEDQDADDVFAIGDELLAAASDGSSVQKIGTITALTADTITVDAKDIFGTTVWSSGALADDDEICFRRPFTFHLGFEY